MGSKQSKNKATEGGQDRRSTSQPTTAASEQRSATPLSTSPQESSVKLSSQIDVAIAGVNDADRDKLLLSPTLSSAILRCLGPEYYSSNNTAQWLLLFNTACHGKSFARLVQHICDNGPVVILIRDADTQRVFGGFNETAWKLVATREREAKSSAAAAARAAREGLTAEPGRPGNQSRLYFGSDRCFMFSDTLPNGTRVAASEDVPIYRSKPSANSNFMYLFDTHPDDDKMGIGMGGQPGQFAWFLDRFLEKGSCKGARCPTFGNPMLVPLEEWTVDVVEAYAVHPRVVAELTEAIDSSIKDGRTVVDKQKNGEKSITRRGAESNCDKMLLELDMRHHFHGDDVATTTSSDGGDEAAGGDHQHCPPAY